MEFRGQGQHDVPDQPPQWQDPTYYLNHLVSRAILSNAEECANMRMLVHERLLEVQRIQDIETEIAPPTFPSASPSYNAHVSEELQLVTDALRQYHYQFRGMATDIMTYVEHVSRLVHSLYQNNNYWYWDNPFEQTSPQITEAMQHELTQVAPVTATTDQSIYETLNAYEEEARKLEKQQHVLTSVAQKALLDVLEIMEKPGFLDEATPSEEVQYKLIKTASGDLVRDDDPEFKFVAETVRQLSAFVPNADELPPTQLRSYYLDKNKLLVDGQRVTTQGVCFYKSTNLDDPADTPMATWGSFVKGVPVDSGKHWIKVGSYFMPVQHMHFGQQKRQQRVIFALPHVVGTAARALRDVIALFIARKSEPGDRNSFDAMMQKSFKEVGTKLKSQMHLSYSKVLDTSSFKFLSKANRMALQKGPRKRRVHKPVRSDSDSTRVNDPQQAVSSTDEHDPEQHYIEVAPPPGLSVALETIPEVSDECGDDPA